MAKQKKTRLDQYLVEEGYVENSDRAVALVMAGMVRVDGVPASSVALQVSADSKVFVKETNQFVSRGGTKLDHALGTFAIVVQGQVCADVGAATGGFSDALLQRGAEKIYAVDVGYGDLHWKVRSNPRVFPIERTNARYLETLPEPVSLVAIDASFISLGLLIPAVVNWLSPTADLILLVKPQFEALQEEVGEGGIVVDPEIHQRVIRQVAHTCISYDLHIRGLIASPILGGQGNKEFLLWVRRDPQQSSLDIELLLSRLR